MKVTCPTCLGSTRVIEIKTDANGRNVRVEKKCPTCGGKGLVEQR